MLSVHFILTIIGSKGNDKKKGEFPLYMGLLKSDVAIMRNSEVTELYSINNIERINKNKKYS